MSPSSTMPVRLIGIYSEYGLPLYGISDWRCGMPELSRFFGIIIRMMYQDESEHHKPHVHVY
ncbi:hypothetical protein BSTEL_1219 [Bifidobacterium stellenboschense]|uniref:DUF4160 domain-containing protein n=1 Tax=Bifidobacterium stellenboschense TaxID=762211 RepID=A0A087DGA0_9BIFI|nr:hypothetical protein BSTEL_1219 [Bifidobacterium stellenboschense]